MAIAGNRGSRGAYPTPPRAIEARRRGDDRGLFSSDNPAYGQGGEHSGAIPALRYRQPLGDKDIRDSWARGKGSAFDENLPAFLDRRGGSAIVLRDAA
jgi:hypothetical protein